MAIEGKRLYCSAKCFHMPSWSSSKPSSQQEQREKDDKVLSVTTKRKPGGWRAKPFILGNETFERLATFGLSANFTVYLVEKLHMDQVSASNIVSIWSGVSNFAPLVGAFISDAYVGKFRTIAF